MALKLGPSGLESTTGGVIFSYEQNFTTDESVELGGESNSGLTRVSTRTGFTLSNNSDLNLTESECGACMVHTYTTGNGAGAVFFASYYGGTQLVKSSGGHSFSTSGNNSGSINVYKSGNGHTCTIQNKTGGPINLAIAIYASRARK